MARYFLDCELRKKGEFDYNKLHDELEKLKAVQVLESLWCFVRFSTSAKVLCDHFARYVDANDAIAVTEITDWALQNARGTPDDLP